MNTDNVSFLIDKLGGRKVVATVLALAAGGIAVAFKGDVPANYLALLQTALGAFVGGNIAEHWSKNLQAAKGGGSKKGDSGAQPGTILIDPGPAVAAIDKKLGTLEEKATAQMELLTAVGQSVHAVNEILAQAKGRK